MYEQARTAVLAWQQTVDAAWQQQEALLAAPQPADGVDDVLAGGLRWWGELDQRVWHQVGEAGDDLIDGLGARGGEFLRGMGNLFGNQDLTRMGDEFQAAANRQAEDFAESLLATGADNRSDIFKAATAIDGDKEPVTVIIRRENYPESAAHIDAAQGGTSYRGTLDSAYEQERRPELTLNRKGAESNRRDSLRGVPGETGKDRDEYPPAMFKQGGEGASVLNISRSDNRGAGASMGNQLRYAPVLDSVGRQTRRVEDNETVIIETY